jgi:hypothetical protein
MKLNKKQGFTRSVSLIAQYEPALEPKRETQPHLEFVFHHSFLLNNKTPMSLFIIFKFIFFCLSENIMDSLAFIWVMALDRTTSNEI